MFQSTWMSPSSTWIFEEVATHNAFHAPLVLAATWRCMHATLAQHTGTAPHYEYKPLTETHTPCGWLFKLHSVMLLITTSHNNPYFITLSQLVLKSDVLWFSVLFSWCFISAYHFRSYGNLMELVTNDHKTSQKRHRNTSRCVLILSDRLLGINLFVAVCWIVPVILAQNVLAGGSPVHQVTSGLAVPGVVFNMFSFRVEFLCLLLLLLQEMCNSSNNVNVIGHRKLETDSVTFDWSCTGNENWIQKVVILIYKLWLVENYFSFVAVCFFFSRPAIEVFADS